MLQALADATGVPLHAITHPRRTDIGRALQPRREQRARQVAFYLLRGEGMSYGAIAAAFGVERHTVLAGARRVANRLLTDEALQELVEDVRGQGEADVDEKNTAKGSEEAKPPEGARHHAHKAPVPLVPRACP